MTSWFRFWSNATQEPPENEARTHIFQTLNQLQEKHALIYLSLSPDSKSPYQSIILSVDDTLSQLIIDDIFPAGLELQHGQSITVTIKDGDHHSLCFESQIVEVTPSNQGARYTLALPQYLTGQQRREAFRLHIDGNCYWNAEENLQQHCEILDISATGVQLWLDNLWSGDIQEGQLIEQCHVALPGFTFTCSLRVMRVIEATPHHPSKTTLGTQVVTIDQHARHQLEHYLMKQQRHRRMAPVH